MNHCVQELSYYSQQGKQIVQMLLYYVVKLIPCSGLVGITEIPNWELGISVFPQWFVCWNYWMIQMSANAF